MKEKLMGSFRSAPLNDDYFKDFYLCYCEKQEYPSGFRSEPWVRDHYTLCHVAEGKGRIISGRKERPLFAGQGILILPGTFCRYQADEGSSFQCLRIGFAGERVKEVLEELNFYNLERIFFSSHLDQLTALSEQMLDSTRGTLEQILLRQSLLYEYLSVLAADLEEEGHLDGGFNEYVTKAIGWIREHYGDSGLRVSDLADELGITRNYLFTLFKEAMGHSPLEYITSFRLSRARELLAGTEYSIDGISYSCGYEDPAVFSRAFKRKYHMTPSRYRIWVMEQGEGSPFRCVRKMQDFQKMQDVRSLQGVCKMQADSREEPAAKALD